MSSSTDQPYRGSPKHKNRPGTGAKGTLCPEWTHAVEQRSFDGETYTHPWHNTAAHRLFVGAVVHSDGRRYATERGIAFEAKPTADGTWHGYPIPWESVPPAIKDRWIEERKVSRRDVKLFRHRDPTDIHWALDTDEP